MGEMVNDISVTSPVSIGANTYHLMEQGKQRGEKEQKNIDLSRETVQDTVKAIKDYIENHSSTLKMSVHKATGQIVVKVISEKDGKIIREIPPEELLDLATRMKEFTGILFDENI